MRTSRIPSATALGTFLILGLVACGTGSHAAPPASPPPSTVRAHAMACSGNSATVDENICTNATTCPDAAQVRYWLYEAIGSPTSHGPWRRLPSQCLDPGPADPSPPAAPKDIP